jgi:hypothetical protein
MDSQQAFFRFGPKPVHRYQVLDELFEEEERMSSLPQAKMAPASLATGRTAPSVLGEGPYKAPSGNPYAKIDNSPPLPGEAIKKALPEGAAARNVEAELRRILKQYSPTAGSVRRLRAEFRAFITSTLKKSAVRRAQILEELRKYDLEADGFAPPLFNREMGQRLTKKLQDLDQDADDEPT